MLRVSARVKTRVALLLCVLGAGAFAGAAKAGTPDILWKKGPLMYYRGYSSVQVPFSPDGRYFALRDDSFTEIRRTSDQQVVFTLPGGDSNMTGLAVLFSADGQTILTVHRSSDYGASVRVWSANDGALLKTLEYSGGPVRVSADGRYVVTSDDAPDGQTALHVRSLPDDRPLYSVEGVRLWSLGPAPDTLVTVTKTASVRILKAGDGSLIREIPASALGIASPEELLTFSPSPDGSTLLIYKNGVGELRSAADGRLLGSFPNVYRWSFSPGGRFLLTADANTYQTTVWESGGAAWVPVTAAWAASPSPTFTPDDTGVVTRVEEEGGKVVLWNTSSGGKIQEFPAYGSPVGFTPDGGKLVLASPTSNSSSITENLVSFWRVSDGGRADDLNAHRDVSALAFSPDDSLLATVGGDGAIRLWKADDGTLLQTWKNEQTAIKFTKLTFSPDGRTLTGEYRNLTRTFSVPDGQFLGEKPVDRGVASPDGRHVAAESTDPLHPGIVEVRRADDGSLVHTLGDGLARIVPVAFTPDGESLLTQTFGGAIDTPNRFEVWDVNDGKLLRTVAALSGAVTVGTPITDGRTLAFYVTETLNEAGDEKVTLMVYGVADGALLNQVAFNLFARSVYPVFGINVVQDRYMTVDGVGNAAKLWKLTTGELLQTFEMGTFNFPRSMVLTPDGKYVRAYDNHRIVYWSVADGKRVREFDQETSQIVSYILSPGGRYVAYLEGRRVLVVASNPVRLTGGDVNDDGRVDVADVVLSLQFITELTVPSDRERQAADMNRDDRLTIADAVLILQVALGVLG